LRTSEKTINNYLEHAPDIKAANEAVTANKIRTYGDKVKEELAYYQNELAAAEQQHQAAVDRHSALVDAGEVNLHDAKRAVETTAENLKAVNDAYTQKMAEEGVALEQQKLGAQDQVAAESAKVQESTERAKADRDSQIQQLEGETRNVPQSAIDRVREALETVKQETSNKAKQQIQFLRDAGEDTVVNIAGLKDHLKKEIQKEKRERFYW
jgi:hypothetical protein